MDAPGEAVDAPPAEAPPAQAREYGLPYERVQSILSCLGSVQRAPHTHTDGVECHRSTRSDKPPGSPDRCTAPSDAPEVPLRTLNEFTIINTSANNSPVNLAELAYMPPGSVVAVGLVPPMDGQAAPGTLYLSMCRESWSCWVSTDNSRGWNRSFVQGHSPRSLRCRHHPYWTGPSSMAPIRECGCAPRSHGERSGHTPHALLARY